MSYSLFDSQGVHISQVASIGGMNDVLDFVDRFPKWGPLSNFLNTGETSDVLGVLNEIKFLVGYATDPGVRETLLELAVNLEKVKGPAIISE